MIKLDDLIYGLAIWFMIFGAVLAIVFRIWERDSGQGKETSATDMPYNKVIRSEVQCKTGRLGEATGETPDP